MPRAALHPVGLFDSRSWGFSQVVKSPPGTTVHVSGQVAWDANREVTAVGREAQLRRTLANVFIALATAGGTPNDIQMLHIYIPNFKSGAESSVIGHVLVDVFGTESPPASSWIGVESLAQPEYLVEVEAIAIVVG